MEFRRVLFRSGDQNVEGLDVLIYGTRHPTEFGWLPRSAAVRLGWPWAQGRTDDPWDIEAQAEPLAFGDPSPRPANILNVEDAASDPDDPVTKPLAADARSLLTGLHWSQVAPDNELAVPHCHSAEEEVFIVLDGSG